MLEKVSPNEELLSPNDTREPLIGESEEEEGGEGSTFGSALTNTVKTVVGSGVIALPYAVQKAGYLSGIIGLVIIAWLSVYTMKLLVYGMKAVRHKRMKEGEPMRGEVTCREIGELAGGKWGKLATDIILISCQWGACCAFAAFVMTSFHAVIGHPDDKKIGLYVLLVITPIFVVLCCLRSTENLVFTSTIGNFLFLFSIIMYLYLGSSTSPPSLHGDKFNQVVIDGVAQCKGFPDCVSGSANAFTSIGGFSAFFGLAIFAFSAHAETMAIEQCLPQKIQKQYFRVLDIALFIALCIYLIFSLFGYFCYGDNTQDNIFKNLPCDGTFTNDDASITYTLAECTKVSKAVSNLLGKAVRGCMAACITFNYPFTMFGAVQNVEDIIWPNVPPRQTTFVESKRCILRAFMTILASVVAYTLPNFGFLVGFVGCFSNGLLAFCLPPFYYARLYNRERDLMPEEEMLKPWQVWANYALSLGGFVFSMASTVMLCLNQFG